MRLVIVKALIVGLLTGTGVACSRVLDLPTSPSAAAALPSTSIAPGALSASPVHARLYLTKTCDAACPVTPICTVMSSPDGPLPVGTQAYYTFAVIDLESALRLSAQLELTLPGDAGTASGHCTLSFKTGLGRCVFTGGTGDLEGFHATLDVRFSPQTGITEWEGTYHFVGR